MLIFTKSGSYDTLTLSYLNGTTAYTLKATHDIERWEMSNITGFKTGAYKVNWKDGYNTLYSNNMVLLDNAYGNYAPLSAVWIWGATQPDLADRQIIGLASSTANLYYYYTGQYYNDYTNVCPASLHNLAAAIYDLLDSVQSSAQSYYNWCAVNNPTSAPPDPTWMFPDPSQYEGIGYEQWLIMYQAWLDGMKDWFNNNTNYLPDNVTMSAESLNLKVRGAIYNATGVLKYSNLTIWTPVISIKSMTLKIGRVNFTPTGDGMDLGSCADHRQPDPDIQLENAGSRHRMVCRHRGNGIQRGTGQRGDVDAHLAQGDPDHVPQ